MGLTFALSFDVQLGEASFAECINFDSNLPSQVHLIPRASSSLAPSASGEYLFLIQ